MKTKTKLSKPKFVATAPYKKINKDAKKTKKTATNLTKLISKLGQ